MSPECKQNNSKKVILECFSANHTSLTSHVFSGKILS